MFVIEDSAGFRILEGCGRSWLAALNVAGAEGWIIDMRSGSNASNDTRLRDLAMQVPDVASVKGITWYDMRCATDSAAETATAHDRSRVLNERASTSRGAARQSARRSSLPTAGRPARTQPYLHGWIEGLRRQSRSLFWNRPNHGHNP